jgi:TonB family protein
VGKSTSLLLVKGLECAICLALISSGPSCLSAQAQGSDLILTRVAEAQLDSLASRVGEKIKKQYRDTSLATVLVFDFTAMPLETSSRLGTLLADRFSELLKDRGTGIEVIDRKVLKDYFKVTYTTVEDLNSNLLCLEFAKEMGATYIVRANLVEDGDRQLNVLVQILGYGPGLFDDAQFLITKEMENMLSEPDVSFSRAPDTIPPEPGILVLGSNGLEGVSEPTCITCPDAKYTEAARAKKLNGTVALSAVITATGDVTSIYVVKPLPLGLTQRAIHTIKDWKLKPAMKDGKPIAVRVDITVTFRLL